MLRHSTIRKRALAMLALAVLIAAPVTADEAKRMDPADEARKAEKTDEAERVEKAAEVLRAAVSGEDAEIPKALLEKAWGVAVIPHVVKGAALAVGGRWGKGVVARRAENGKWSAPAFVSLGGASYGFQIGVEATDLVLVFTDPKGIDALLEDHLKLGAEAGVTAGPIGRKAEAGVNLTLDSAIYSYSRSKGLFAGVSLDGAVVDVDQDANAKVYGKDVTAKQLLDGKAGPNATVQPFLTALAKHVPAREA